MQNLSGRYAAGQPQDQNIFGVWVKQHREVGQQDLGVHIHRAARRIGFPAVEQGKDLIAQNIRLGFHHGCKTADAVPEIQQFSIFRAETISVP